MKLKHTVSIVIPFFNEKDSLIPLLEKLEKTELSPGTVVEYIFVDDGSRDGSFEKLRNRIHGIKKRRITLIRFRKNSGKSAALSVGFGHATGDYVVMMDADLQDEPAEIPRMIRALDDGSDMVIGWRRDRKDKLSKRISSKIFNALVSRLYHVSLRDMNSGLKAMKREVVREIRLYGELHRYFPVLAAARGFRVSEIPVAHHTRQFGRSKFNSKRIIHAFFDLTSTLFITSFEHEPMQVFGITGGIGILSGTVILTYLSVLHFMGESIGRRPLLFLGMLFVLFGMQMVSTGLMGELIIHKQRHDEQNYPIAEIVK